MRRTSLQTTTFRLMIKKTVKTNQSKSEVIAVKKAKILKNRRYRPSMS